MRKLFVAVSLALLATSAPAVAARKPISGKLSRPGYTVIALAPGGKARVVRARSGRFKVRPPARSVTLHLRARNGIYAGPVVVGSNRKSVILGVRPGARLGKIKVRRGYASVTRRPRTRWVDANSHARARRGTPIGAGRFGRVRSRRVRAPVPGDSDIDGIPDVLDVDDDGDRILDKLERPRARRAARTAQDGEQFGIHSRLTLYLDTTANANAAGLTDAQMDAALAYGGDLLLQILPGDSSPNSPEVDCGGSIQQPPRPDGLIYCRPHSSGGIGTAGYPQPGVPFPDCCDPDGDGFGTLVGDFGTLHHRSTTSQVGTGDVLIQRVIRGGVETSFLAALQYVFATVPAVVSYDDDGPGGPVQVTYPFPGPDPMTGLGGGPGLRENPAPVSDGPDADNDVELTLIFWRPQREALAQWGETGDWIDIGRLKYEVQVEESGRRCPQSAFTESDPDLAPNAPSDINPGFTDLQGDRPARPTNTFTYTLNLTKCLEATGFSFNPGDESAFSFVARSPSGPDNAQQGVFFKRQ